MVKRRYIGEHLGYIKVMKIEIAQYIAGLIEADGTIHWYQHGKFKQLGISISSNDIDFLKQLCILTSSLNLNWKINEGTKKRLTIFPFGKSYQTVPNYQLKLYHYPSIKVLLTQVAPYLYGPKSVGLDTIFKILDLYKVRSKEVERAKLFETFDIEQDNAEGRSDIPPSPWMAGFLDGDGTITVKVDKRFISIFNSDLQILNILKGYLDSRLYEYHTSVNQGGYISYTLKGVSRYSFLKEIEPYLIYKRVKAVKLLEYLKPVETTCGAPVTYSIQDEDIVRPIWRHIDTYRNICTPS